MGWLRSHAKSSPYCCPNQSNELPWSKGPSRFELLRALRSRSAHGLRPNLAVRQNWAQSPIHCICRMDVVVDRVWTRYALTERVRAAMCVQRFDDSLGPAIRITYRVSRRSSSLWEPRDPSLKDICRLLFIYLVSNSKALLIECVWGEKV